MIDRISSILVGVLVFVTFANAQDARYGNTIDQILAKPEDSIDIGIACLTLAKDVYPNLRIETFDRILNSMAERVNMLAEGHTEPEGRIGLLNTFFFRPGWWNDSLAFTYDLEDLAAARRTNRYLNGYISTRRGSCVTMSMLYLAVADRLKWPIVPVRAAKHIFCRYIASGFKENNIEATCGGGYLDDGQYIEQAGIPKKAIKNRVYMRTLTKKEYIATLLSNHALQLIEDGRLDEAARYLRLSISFDRSFSTAYWNLGEWHEEQARLLETAMNQELQTELALSSATRGVSSDLPAPSAPIASRRKETSLEENGFSQQSLSFSIGSNQTPDNRHSATQSKPPLDPQTVEELTRIRATYEQKIRDHLLVSQVYQQRAKDLGIVLKFPEEFFIRQAKAIEDFRKTGRY